jgi:hypothetical protein
VGPSGGYLSPPSPGPRPSSHAVPHPAVSEGARETEREELRRASGGWRARIIRITAAETAWRQRSWRRGTRGQGGRAPRVNRLSFGARGGEEVAVGPGPHWPSGNRNAHGIGNGKWPNSALLLGARSAVFRDSGAIIINVEQRAGHFSRDKDVTISHSLSLSLSLSLVLSLCRTVAALKARQGS